MHDAYQRGYLHGSTSDKFDPPSWYSPDKKKWYKDGYDAGRASTK